MRFIHCADLHIDSPMRGLERYDGAPVDALRGATRRAFEELVQFACAQAVDFVLIAGDVFDEDWRDYNTGLFFVRQVSLLADAQIPVVLLRGNHDAASHITRQLNYPRNVKELSTSRPETYLLEDLGVAIHGQGFAHRAVTDDLSQAYPAPTPGCFNIGMLHTCGEGADGHAPYAPCRTDSLRHRKYDYWALGHVHKRRELCQDPWIVFPGNLQGRHAGETGAKGCALVQVDDGEVTAVRQCVFDVVRWSSFTIPRERARCQKAALEAIDQELRKALAEAEERHLAVRVEVEASGDLATRGERFVNEVRARGLQLGEQVWVEKVKLLVPAAEDRRFPVGEEETSELLRYVDDLRSDPGALEGLANHLADLREKLPVELRAEANAIVPDDADTVLAKLPEVMQFVLGRLEEAGLSEA